MTISPFNALAITCRNRRAFCYRHAHEPEAVQGDDDSMSAKPQSAAVQKRLETLGRLINGSPVVVFLWRIEVTRWPVEVVSANVRSLLGYSPDDFTSGRISWPGITHPEDIPGLEQEVKDLLAARHDQWSQQYRLITKDERIVWVEDWNRVLRDADGKATHIQAFVMDITARKSAEEALRQTEERYRRLFESSRDAIMTLEPPSWRFTSGNPATVSMFKAASERDFTAHEPWKLSPDRQPDGRPSGEKAAHMIKTAMRKGSHFFEWTHARIGGEVFPATVLLTRVESGGRTFLQATVRDITAQKQAEEALLASEEKYRALIETTTTGFLILDACGKVIDANREYVRLSGHDELAQILGRSVAEWTAPCDLERNSREVKRCAAQGLVRNLEIDYVGRGGGENIPVEINATVVGSGRSVRIFALCRDITERRRAELELRERSRQLAQVASELTVSEQRERRRLAELLHEHLQQLLVAARMQVHSIAAKSGKRDREGLEGLHRVLNEALAASRSVMRDLAPPVSMHKDLPAALRWLKGEMSMRHHLAVSLRMGETVTPVTEAVAVLLFTAARELLLNVVKHAGCGRASLCLRKEPGAIVLAVSDDGKGAKPEAVQDPSRPRGFGLFSIRERSELLGGKLVVDTRPRRGMRVTLSLPLPSEVPTPAKPFGRAARNAGRRRTGRPRGRHPDVSGQPIRVVFADDHRTVREGLVSLIRPQGGIAIVGEAENGEQAVECVKRLRPDVVVMDVSMPVMDGVEATRVIAKRWPEVRVIGLSMYDDAVVAQRMRDAGATDYVAKSAPPGRLIAAILACASIGATA